MKIDWVRMVVALGVVAVAAAGCGSDAPAPTERIFACWGTEAPRPDSGVVNFSFQQHGKVISTASGPPDFLMSAVVPAGGVTTILANGEPFGEVGVEGGDAAVAADQDGQTPGYYAVMGPGCPDPSLGAP